MSAVDELDIALAVWVLSNIPVAGYSLHGDDHFPMVPVTLAKALNFQRALGTSFIFVTPLSCRIWTLLSCAQQGGSRRRSVL